MSDDPALVFDLATAFWRSSVLFTACKMRLFDKLEGKPLTVNQAAKELGASERGMFGLLESCVAVGLLCKKGDAFQNTETAMRYLTEGSPDSLLTTLLLQFATYPMWANLPEAVTSGNPVMQPGDLLGGRKELTRHFVVGMHQRALGVGRSLVNELDLAGRKSLADIGGGPGTYSVLLVEKNEGLRSRILDLAPILEITRELVDQSSVGERIETVPCNAETDEFGSGYDVVLISGLLHRMTGEQIRSIFRRAHDAMDPGGLIIVNDLFSTDEGPEMAVLFGLQMLLTNNTGRTHSVSDISGWLGESDFKNLETRMLPPPLPHSLVMGIK